MQAPHSHPNNLQNMINMKKTYFVRSLVHRIQLHIDSVPEYIVPARYSRWDNFWSTFLISKTQNLPKPRPNSNPNNIQNKYEKTYFVRSLVHRIRLRIGSVPEYIVPARYSRWDNFWSILVRLWGQTILPGSLYHHCIKTWTNGLVPCNSLRFELQLAVGKKKSKIILIFLRVIRTFIHLKKTTFFNQSNAKRSNRVYWVKIQRNRKRKSFFNKSCTFSEIWETQSFMKPFLRFPFALFSVETRFIQSFNFVV